MQDQYHDLDIATLFALGYPQKTLKNLLHQMVEMAAYELKPVYVGQTPVLRVKARWYSPLLWIQYLVLILLSVTVLPFMHLAAVFLRFKSEFKWRSRRAEAEWEREFVELNARPPADFQI